jgi:spore coat protein U-like protein
MKKNVFATLALISAAGFAVNAFAASPATTTFQVLFKVNKSCSVTATDLNLGALDSSATVGATGGGTGSGTVVVNCSKNTAYTIGLVGAGAMSGLATGNTTTTVAYGLYKDAGFVTVWGNTGSATVGGTGTGAAQPAVPVYGKVTGSVNVTPDDYKDTVTVNVVY